MSIAWKGLALEGCSELGWERQSKEEESVDKGMMVGKVADIAHEK